jgi:hypothetical protein
VKCAVNLKLYSISCLNVVEEVFDMHVSNFESIASKWLCNKKFMHFNVVSFYSLGFVVE